MIWWLMIVEPLVEWELSGETEVPGENLPQYHFSHHIPHNLTWDRTRAVMHKKNEKQNGCLRPDARRHLKKTVTVWRA
jgi:hypothetical protein